MMGLSISSRLIVSGKYRVYSEPWEVLTLLKILFLGAKKG